MDFAEAEERLRKEVLLYVDTVRLPQWDKQNPDARESTRNRSRLAMLAEENRALRARRAEQEAERREGVRRIREASLRSLDEQRFQKL